MLTFVRPLPRLLTVLLLLLLACPPGASGAEPLVLNTADPAPFSRPDGTGMNDRIVTEALRQLGMTARLVRLPAERALQNANQGIEDGIYVRIAGLERLYPNLIMVPEPVAEFVFTAFTSDPVLKAQTWADLKPWNVGIITGWKILEANITGTRSLVQVKDEKALFALLGKGRTDVVVVEQSSGLEVIRQMGLTGIRSLEPPLARRDMFIYLHKRHADLAPRLAQALRQMRRDGTLERLTKAGLGAGLKHAGKSGAGQ